MLYIRFPLSLRNVEDPLHERGIDVSHETVRYWWNTFGPVFSSEIQSKRGSATSSLYKMEVALGLGLRESERQEALSVADRGL